jgi:DNA-binding beta-propeller fold protein YncE
VDTSKLLADAAHSIVTRIRVGKAPVGVALVDNGRKVISTNANRFAGGADDRQSLNVVDIAGGAANAVLLGTVPAGAFPRELCVSPDGRTLFVSNFSSRTLEVVDLSRLVLQKSP